MRVSLNLPDDLVKQIDKLAEEKCVSRSAFVSLTVAEKLQQETLIKQMPDLLDSLKQMQLKIVAAQNQENK